MKLGKLKEVDIRTVWSHEQYDFSKWLASEENIGTLGDELNLSLTEIETEKLVGTYRCDIVCKDETSGKTVLIENQLESTDHDHLGKLVTYASVLNASVVVWVVANAREEHASAIEWLNQRTTSEVDFFLVEIHVYAIGDSVPAPKFKVIEQPNDFAKSVKTLANRGEITETEERRLEFWSKFNDVLEQRGKPFNRRKASTDNWYDVAVGKSQCLIRIELVNKEHKIRVSLLVKNKEMYEEFYSRREEIETAFEEPLDWKTWKEKAKSSSFSTDIPGLDFNNQENYQELMELTIEKVIKLREAVKPFLN
ncbi:MAG: DUF4268 domain-containing protein [Thermoguttaceae bacterium]|nr:DUF4268 domain-containing protein [Thermoguttaceae bacterium]